ncbi:MAG: Holliday junction resolvase RuvX [Candidatus Izemoplasmataceae bacterium]
MKKLGLDLGDASLGIAISDREGKFARGYENLKFKNQDVSTALEKVLELLKTEPIDTIVLGYPKNMDGSVGPQAKASERFKKKLEKKTGVPVVLYDERLTSKRAQSVMIDKGIRKKKRRTTIDEHAAVVILQDYLDATSKGV